MLDMRSLRHGLVPDQSRVVPAAAICTNILAELSSPPESRLTRSRRSCRPWMYVATTRAFMKGSSGGKSSPRIVAVASAMREATSLPSKYALAFRASRSAVVSAMCFATCTELAELSIARSKVRLAVDLDNDTDLRVGREICRHRTLSGDTSRLLLCLCNPLRAGNRLPAA